MLRVVFQEFLFGASYVFDDEKSDMLSEWSERRYDESWTSYVETVMCLIMWNQIEQEVSN
jgi:hypothetical protein